MKERGRSWRIRNAYLAVSFGPTYWGFGLETYKLRAFNVMFGPFLVVLNRPRQWYSPKGD